MRTWEKFKNSSDYRLFLVFNKEVMD
jgi:hypothetical protein